MSGGVTLSRGDRQSARARHDHQEAPRAADDEPVSRDRRQGAGPLPTPLDRARVDAQWTDEDHGITGAWRPGSQPVGGATLGRDGRPPPVTRRPRPATGASRRRTQTAATRRPTSPGDRRGISGTAAPASGTWRPRYADRRGPGATTWIYRR